MGLAAEKYRISYRIDGHSFRTEGSAPMGMIYMDARATSRVCTGLRHAADEDLPHLWLHRQLRWMLLRRSEWCGRSTTSTTTRKQRRSC